MKKLLVIGNIWPEPKTTAAGNRMMQLLDTFLENNFEITFSCTATKTKYSEDLIKKGIKEVGIVLNDSSFDNLIAELNPDIVIFDRFMIEEQFGWRVAQNTPGALRILNTEDLHSLRESRQICHKKRLEWSTALWLQHDKTKRELASIYRSDLTLVVSIHEQNLLCEIADVNEELIMHLPFLLSEIDESVAEKFPKFEERKDFITFGNGKHAPNIDSFQYLRNEIWPFIRKELPGVNLHIYGAYLPQKIIEMHNPKKGFLVHGWIDDLEREIEKAKVLLAPLRFGAGIKGKLTSAMQCGTPSVTTEIGVEGMHESLQWPGFIADEPLQMAESAIELYTNQSKWELVQDYGVEIVNTLYNKSHLSERFQSRLRKLIQNLKVHREGNVVGSLLQHQSMAASKFMGKWIEEKNRRV